MSRVIKFRVWHKHHDHDKVKQLRSGDDQPESPYRTGKTMDEYQEDMAAWSARDKVRWEQSAYYKMHYPAGFATDGCQMGWTSKGFLDVGACSDDKTNVDEEPDSVVEQWTGLLDKNGREIYEGDIVCWTGGRWPEGGVGQIVWQDCGLSIHPIARYGSPGMVKEHIIKYAIEVIGNLHEHPQLLQPN